MFASSDGLTTVCRRGAASVVVYYVGINQLGVYDDTWGTYIWTFELGGNTYSLWQEYALFFTLPISLIGFIIGNLLGEPHDGTPAQGAAA